MGTNATTSVAERCPSSGEAFLVGLVAERFDAVESGAAEVGGRVHLRWRLRLQAERLGRGWFVQQATTAPEHAKPNLDPNTPRRHP